jgi:phosphoglycerate dehydrogenase-like enzyme
MKIAFQHKENEFNNQLLDGFRARLPEHEVLSWQLDQAAPCQDLEAVISTGKVERECLDSQPRLAFIQTASTGYESVDIDAATELGIWVSYAPSDITGNAISVAEFAVLLILGAARRIGEELRAQAKGEVSPVRINPALFGKTVCIVGLGAIGKLLMDRLRPFGVKIVATKSQANHAPEDVTIYTPDQLKEAVSEADFVVICVRASEENKHLIDAEIFAAMKRGANVINIARGSLIDEDALRSAIESGQVRSAALDVLAHEPPDPKDPLLALPDVLVTPHRAGLSDLMLEGTIDYIVEAINEVAKGNKPESVLNSPQHPRIALR